MNGQLSVGIAHPNEVDGLWPLLRDGFAKACEVNPGYSPGQIWQLCRSGQAFLCIAHEDGQVLMASVWQFTPYKDTHSFHCIALYGAHMRRWLRPAADFLTDMASKDGATVMTFCGRNGWARLFNATRDGEYYEVAINGRR